MYVLFISLDDRVFLDNPHLHSFMVESGKPSTS